MSRGLGDVYKRQVVKDTTSHGLPVGSFVGTEITGDTVALTNVQWVTAASAGSLGLLEII